MAASATGASSTVEGVWEGAVLYSCDVCVISADLHCVYENSFTLMGQ